MFYFILYVRTALRSIYISALPSLPWLWLITAHSVQMTEVTWHLVRWGEMIDMNVCECSYSVRSETSTVSLLVVGCVSV